MSSLKCCIKVQQKLEEQILEKQKDLIEAKTKSLQSTERIEELYKEAMSAFRRYSGSGESDEV